MSAVGMPHRRVPLTSGLLRPEVGRGRSVRVALAIAIVAGAVAAVVIAARSHTAPQAALQHDGGGVIVLDVSGSIAPVSYARIERALDDEIKTGKSYGLVLFSDVAYEALPPASKPSALRAVRRYFAPVKDAESAGFLRMASPNGRTYLTNPWTGAFSGGTRMSAGLELALHIIHRDRIPHPGVLLISDLGYSLGDAGALATVLSDYKDENVDLRIASVGAGPEGRAFFERMLQGEHDLGNPPSLTHFAAPAGGGRPLPSPLVAVAAALLLLLVLNELWCGRLTWGEERS
jgi:hypothetical protein